MNFMPAAQLHRSPLESTWAHWILGVSLFVAMSGSAFAQSKDRDKNKERNDGANETELAARLTKAEETLLKEYKDVVNEHYKQGRKENAIEVLQRMMAINPKMEGVEDQIKLINEELLQENGIKMEMDVSKGWVPICEVEEGKAFRIAVVGDYKLDLTTPVPLTGLSTSDPAKDHVAAAPFGALIGLVMTDGKPGEPFAVNTGLEQKPKKGGQLFLRVNVPVIAKCKGELKLQASGAVKPIGKRPTK
ncbi:MAG: hypothetical protein U0936_08795 [Planctomycetaceae bacterium]